MTVRELFTYRVLTISNLLSLSRMLAVPALWYILAHPHDIERVRLYTALTLFFMIATDFFDGYLARRLGQET
ncbi:MAG: CDP-alcohol phosphatidyltransferase family protein, partial [Leptospiraceae bacterium]|nr:CDP-alcohol phosphatidyltransferase family protein [Leptospiraceae bacterium]